MKKFLSVLLALLMLSAFAFAEEANLAGGWEMHDVTEAIPDEAMDAFAKAFAEFDGASYEPVALLSSQVVAGMNYCFLCKTTPVEENPVSYWSYVYIYADLQGNAQITTIGSMELFTEDDNSRTVADTCTFEASPDAETYVCDLIFTEDVTVTGEGQNVIFSNCEFCGNIINAAPSTTFVVIADDCTVSDTTTCILQSGVREANMEYAIPKFVLMFPIDVVCEDLGAAIAAGDFELNFNGTVYTQADTQYVSTESGLVEYNGTDPLEAFVVCQWWENGEQVLIIFG